MAKKVTKPTDFTPKQADQWFRQESRKVTKENSQSRLAESQMIISNASPDYPNSTKAHQRMVEFIEANFPAPKEKPKTEPKHGQYFSLEGKDPTPSDDYIGDFVKRGIHMGELGTIDLSHIYGGKPGDPSNTRRLFFVGHPVDIGVLDPDNARMVVPLTGHFEPKLHKALKERTGIDPTKYVRPVDQPAPPPIDAPKKENSKKKKPLSEQLPPPEKKSTGRAPADGYTIQMLCDEIKMDPVDARRILRAQKVTKPGTRWEWPSKKEADPVRKVLIDNREAE